MHQWKNNVFLRAALVFLTLFCCVTILSLQFEYNRLKEERDQLREQIAQSEERIENLQSTLSQPFDEEYIIKYAREKLNYRLPEEIVFYNDLNN